MSEERDTSRDGIIREVITSARHLGKRAEQVLERDGETRADVAALRAEMRAELATIRARLDDRQRPHVDRFFDLAHASIWIQRGIALGVVLFALAIAGWLTPGIMAAVPALGGILAP